MLRAVGLVDTEVAALRSAGLLAVAGGGGRLTWEATRVTVLAEAGTLATWPFCCEDGCAGRLVGCRAVDLGVEVLVVVVPALLVLVEGLTRGP